MSALSREDSEGCEKVINNLMYVTGIQTDINKVGPLEYARLLLRNNYPVEAQVVLELAFNRYSCRPSFRPVPPGHILTRLEVLSHGLGEEEDEEGDEEEARTPPSVRALRQVRSGAVSDVMIAFRHIQGGEEAWLCLTVSKKGSKVAGEVTLPLYEVYPCTGAALEAARKALEEGAAKSPEIASNSGRET
mgnify:CR=1 FL=1